MAVRRLPRWRTLATIAFAVILLAPAVHDQQGVPLSSYPMYASVRPGMVSFVVPVGIDVDRQALTLSPTTVASTSDPLIAEAYLRDQIRLGRADALCAEIAARLSRGAIHAVEIRYEQHKVVDYARGRPSLVDREVLATCSAR